MEHAVLNAMNDPAYAVLSKGVLHYVAPDARDHKASYEWLINGGTAPTPPRRISSTDLDKRRRSLDELQRRYEVADETFREWLTYKQKETQLLAAIVEVQDGAPISDLLRLNEELYGVFDTNLFFGYLGVALKESQYKQLDQKLYGSLVKSLDLSAIDSRGQVHTPSIAAFRHYQRLAHTFFEEAFKTFDEFRAHSGRVTGKEVAELVDNLLVGLSLKDDGWQVSLGSRTDKVTVNPHSKRIRIADREFLLSNGRLKGLLLHEVGIHALRRKGKANFASRVPAFLAESRQMEEGLGVVIEQLMLERFHFLRLYRYLAIGFAIGADGKPARTARETYELLWKLRYLAAGVSKERAQRFAALETIRVYKGIALEVAGAVLLKDKAYAEGSDRLWRQLDSKLLDEAAFNILLKNE